MFIFYVELNILLNGIENLIYIQVSNMCKRLSSRTTLDGKQSNINYCLINNVAKQIHFEVAFMHVWEKF